MGETVDPRASDRAEATPGGAKRRRRRGRRRSSGHRPKEGPAGGERAAAEAAVPAPGGAKKKRRRTASGGTRTKSGEPKRKRSKDRRREPRAVTTKREISAGGVVYRRSDDGIEIVLASRRTRRGELAWGLAKGGLEGDESLEDAAVREVREETGLLAEIETSLGETRYFYVWENVRIRKTVHFFLMRHIGGDIDDRDDEMEEIRWFPLERALKRAAYRGERDVLGRAAELLR
ncbi:MAG TPA: NUDIX hydrolase [Actinomycetota bacterium]|nr:NUDIX hydrolase [Actinomycetota bacterium]